jgi:glycosyltransferase involved in cell wall biosynthesis
MDAPLTNMNAPVEKNLFISVIIVCLNEENNIRSCLEHLKNQTYPNDRFEIIVIDNGSTDKTASYASEFTDSVFIIKDANVPKLRNEGGRQAKGDIIAYLDADCEASDTWLSSINAIQREQLCVTGAQCHIKDSESWIPRAWFCQQSKGRKKVAGMGAGNMALPRDLFLTLDGFDETLSTGEDAELCARAADHVPILADGSLVVVHKGVPKTIKEFVSREIWHGLGALGTFKINLIDLPFLGTLWFIGATLGQIAGLMFLLFSGSWTLILFSSFALFLLVSGSVYRRKEFLKGPLHALQLGVLFYFYFLGRSISLMYVLSGAKHKYYRKESR